MLKTICVVVILMGYLNGAASPLSEADHSTVRRYFLEGVKITSERFTETIDRLSTAKIRVEKTLATLRSFAHRKFEDNKHLLDLGLSSWEDRTFCIEDTEKTRSALVADLNSLNRAYSALFPSPGS